MVMNRLFCHWMRSDSEFHKYFEIFLWNFTERCIQKLMDTGKRRKPGLRDAAGTLDSKG